MTNGQDERIFIRSKWGTNRYVYNPGHPVGRALIVGSLLFGLGGMYLLYHPGLLNGADTWDAGELRSAVAAATTELSNDARFGPGTVNFEDILEADIAKHGHSSQHALTVVLASEPPESALIDGGAEQADYTVTAEGTDAAFCVEVHAMKRRLATGYESVAISVGDGACRDADT
ncbi:hypothetical protein ACFC0C_31590 [Streptomyces sp. NPDC056178]|uniref:hypothetical protein n=1 Tax=unclassified Streptomyces TaxID=2593676 RepID=UPI0035DA3243